MAEPGEILFRRDDDGRIWCETWPLPETTLVSLGLLFMPPSMTTGMQCSVTNNRGKITARLEFDTENVSAIYAIGPTSERDGGHDAILVRLVGASQKGGG